MTAPTSDSRAPAVLLVANYESDVGYAWWLMENFWSLIAAGAKASGRECLLTYPKVNTIPPIIAAAPIRIIERRVAPSTFAGNLKIGLFMRRNRVRSVYLTDWPGLYWPYLWWRLMGVRSIVLHDHTPGDRPPSTGLKGAFKAVLHRLGLFSAHYYVGVAEHVRQRHIDNWRVPARKCLVVENGIVPFQPDASRRAELRAQFGVPSDAIMIVSVSRATFYKGLDFAVKVLAKLRERASGTKIHLVHCGDGPDIERLRSLAGDAGLAASMHFLGRRSDVRDILAAGDIAFHPSRGEAMSLAILEFMCAGLPVVLSDLPSVSAAVKDGESALVYRAEDVESATAALLRLATDANLRDRMGQAAAQRCRSHYSLDRTNECFIRSVVTVL